MQIRTLLVLLVVLLLAAACMPAPPELLCHLPRLALRPNRLERLGKVRPALRPRRRSLPAQRRSRPRPMAGRLHQYGGGLQHSLSPELEPDTESAVNARTHDERRYPGRPGRPHRAAVGVRLRRRVLATRRSTWRRARSRHATTSRPMAPTLVTDVREAAPVGVAGLFHQGCGPASADVVLASCDVDI